MKIINLLLIIIILIRSAFCRNEAKINYVGKIYFITQSDNYISFVTEKNTKENYIYVIDKDGNINFRKPTKEKPTQIIICELHKCILTSYYNHEVYEEESYINILYDLDNGNYIDTLALYTYPKLSVEGNFFYSSTHLHDHASPMQIYNLKTKEHFDIPSGNWSKVSSLNKNKLIILEQLSERNKKVTGGTWTQLGTNFKIYDLGKKSIIIDKNLEDNNGYPIIISRDDHNNYSLTVDENNNIFIYGSIKTGPNGETRQYKILKLNETGTMVWAKNINSSGWPLRIEYLNDIQLVIKEQTLNKNSGKFEIVENPEFSKKKIIWSNEFSSLEQFQIGQLVFNLKNKTIIKSN